MQIAEFYNLYLGCAYSLKQLYFNNFKVRLHLYMGHKDFPKINDCIVTSKVLDILVQSIP